MDRRATPREAGNRNQNQILFGGRNVRWVFVPIYLCSASCCWGGSTHACARVENKKKCASRHGNTQEGAEICSHSSHATINLDTSACDMTKRRGGGGSAARPSRERRSRVVWSSAQGGPVSSSCTPVKRIMRASIARTSLDYTYVRPSGSASHRPSRRHHTMTRFFVNLMPLMVLAAPSASTGGLSRTGATVSNSSNASS